MRRANWRVPALWAIAGGVIGYLAIASAGVGASPTFADVNNRHDPQRDIFALRAARHRLVGFAGGCVGLAAGLVLVRLRSPWARAGGGGHQLRAELGHRSAARSPGRPGRVLFDAPERPRPLVRVRVRPAAKQG